MTEACPKCEGKGILVVKQKVARQDRYWRDRLKIVKCDECKGKGIVSSYMMSVRENMRLGYVEVAI